LSTSVDRKEGNQVFYSLRDQALVEVLDICVIISEGTSPEQKLL